MSRFFFDTSALVKRYYEERGSETVDEFVEAPDTDLVITSLSIIETVSAFRRKQSREEIDPSQVDRLLGAFFEETLSGFDILPMSESLYDFSFDLVIEDNRRTLDSLQLSAALSTATEESSPTFICADRELIAVAEDRGLETVNPVERSG